MKNARCRRKCDGDCGDRIKRGVALDLGREMRKFGERI